MCDLRIKSAKDTYIGNYGWWRLKQNTRKIGNLYERKAEAYLKSQGLTIRERNYRCRQGEIDLIAQDGDYLVFVEVKYRSGKNAGDSLAAVNWRKQKVIAEVARHYLTVKLHLSEWPCRFDVIGIDGERVSWIKNAFESWF